MFKIAAGKGAGEGAGASPNEHIFISDMFELLRCMLKLCTGSPNLHNWHSFSSAAYCYVGIAGPGRTAEVLFSHMYNMSDIFSIRQAFLVSHLFICERCTGAYLLQGESHSPFLFQVPYVTSAVTH